MCTKRHLSTPCITAQKRWKTETPVDTLRDLEAKESANKLTDKVADLKVEKVGGTLTDVKCASPV